MNRKHVLTTFKMNNILPQAVVQPAATILFVQLESLSAFVSVFCALPFRLRVLYYSHEGFARLHLPIKSGKSQNIAYALIWNYIYEFT